ncbi:hypothetical protein ATANTOWER_018133 [Ataeniobius toweri]|uniref:UBX domain-containing protein n=1 Tax=Ataeniobius toweri TaxID=208326 RepID=A0ABU7CKR6_9TELE|nr:hypothetical protein [Ataeniobius toweri]
MRKQCYKAWEERHKKAIEERHQRMAGSEEPSSGLMLKFKYPNGFIKMRTFNVSDPIQVMCLFREFIVIQLQVTELVFLLLYYVLFDFVGQDEMASEIFSSRSNVIHTS